MALTLEEANRVIQGALSKARELNVKVSVAICDGGGRLVAFQRMDNAIWASTFGSQGKAIAVPQQAVQAVTCRIPKTTRPLPASLWRQEGQ